MRQRPARSRAPERRRGCGLRGRRRTGGGPAPRLPDFSRLCARVLCRSAACHPAQAPTRPPHFVYWGQSPARIFSLLTHRSSSQQPAASSSTATHSPRLRPCSRNSCVHRVVDVIGARVLVRVLFASRPWRGEEASWRWDGSARRRKRSRRGRGRLGRLCSPRRRLGCLDARDPGCWRYVLRTSRLWGWSGGVWWFLLSCG